MFKSDEDAWEGATLSIKNARTLFASAIIIKDSGNVGCATSLLVLSIEEASKALSIGQYIKDQSTIDYDFEKIFRSHSIKHSQGIKLARVIHYLTCDTHTENCTIIEDIESWEKKAEEYKKRGFYVDYIQNKWHSPKDISNDEYSLNLYIATAIIFIVEGLFINGSMDDFKKSNQ